jgi:AraC-like DNA-binding protein
MSANQANIPSNYSRLMAYELGLSKAQLPSLLAGTGLTVAELVSEQTLITAEQQLVLLRNAVRLSGDTGFGLRLGQRLIPSTHGALGFMAFSSRDLYTAMRGIQAFVPMRMSLANVHLRETAETLECWADFNVPVEAQLHRTIAESFLVVLFKLGEYIVGRPLSEVVTTLDYAEPDYAEQYYQNFPGQVLFSAERFGVSLPMSLCREPNASANHENYMLALQQCQKQRAQLQSDKASYQHRVETMLLEHPPGTINEEDVAAALFMSKRSLARRLAEESTGFRQIREQLLAGQAANYLRESSLSVEAIATLLGYHDSANFRRAFKRWFAVTPADYRES